MYIVKEDKNIYAFKTLQEAEDFSKFLLDEELIFFKNIDTFFNKYKCLTNEANFYLLEIKDFNKEENWQFKCISSNKSAL